MGSSTARPQAGALALALGTVALGTVALGTVALAVMGLGVLLRGAFSGRALPGEFAHLRHAHSHLALYALLFPLAWAAWGRLGARTPSGAVRGVYAAATATAVVGFALQGYALASIAGSTVVLGVWLWSAWGLRGTSEPWLRQVAPALVAAACCVGPIAVLTRRAPEHALRLVAVFLTLLFLGVMTPSALAGRVRAPARLPWLGALGLGAAALAGVEELRLGLVALAALLLRPALALEGAERAAWLTVIGGMLARGLGLLGEERAVAVAGLHQLALGPLLLGLAAREAPRALAWGWLGCVSALNAAVLGQVWWPLAGLPALATHLAEATFALAAAAVLGAAARAYLRWTSTEMSTTSSP